MGRPIYPHELGDPDFSWLISSFREHHPEYIFVESTCLPVVFIHDSGNLDRSLLPAPPLREGLPEPDSDTAEER
jgi:hypothetical protein